MTDWLSYLLYLGYPICKQFPERSFFYEGYQMPVEARDVGIFVGFLFTFLFIFSARLKLLISRGSIRIVVLSSILMLPLMVDAGSSYLSLRQTTNEIRLITGLLFGVGAGVIISGLERDLAMPLSNPFTIKHMSIVFIVIPLHPLIEWSSTSTLAGFVIFSLLSAAGYILLFFIAIRILILESGVKLFNNWKTGWRLFFLTVGLESALFSVLSGLHYLGLMIT
jgi:uncharacterized membrane protein